MPSRAAKPGGKGKTMKMEYTNLIANAGFVQCFRGMKAQQKLCRELQNAYTVLEQVRMSGEVLGELTQQIETQKKYKKASEDLIEYGYDVTWHHWEQIEKEIEANY